MLCCLVAFGDSTATILKRLMQLDCFRLANKQFTVQRHKALISHLFSLASVTLDSRWENSGLSTLVVVDRETFDVAKQKTSFETSYYVSNSVLKTECIKPLAEELTSAIRCHWGVESQNWIRDVTFDEDCIKTKAGNQAQVMALMRGIAIELIRKTSPKNFQAVMNNFADSVSALESMFRQVKFL